METNSENIATDTCCSTCGSADRDNIEPTPVIACSLGNGFKKRAENIEALGQRALLASQREPLRLQLTYSKDALSTLQNLVAKEAECCPFLDFAWQHSDDKVDLTITAPKSAAAIIDELFDSFVAKIDRGIA